MEPLPVLEPELLTRLDAFVRPVLTSVTRQQRRSLARAYVRGLVGSCARKNVEQIAREARGVAEAPAYERRMAAMLSDDDWRHQTVMWEGAHRLAAQTDGWSAYTLDDTSLLKQGTHSVGVANQYAGCVGGLANCQVVVSLGIAQEHASAPLAMQLFVPEAWDADVARRAACHVPSEVRYRPKWQIALDLIRELDLQGFPRRPVLADSAYGDVVAFRRDLQARGQPYVVGSGFVTTVWPAGLTFVPLPSPTARGRPASRVAPDRPCRPLAVKKFAATLPATAWQRVCWRDGSRGAQWGRFAAVRVRPAHGWHGKGIHPDKLCAEEWLLLHWPDDAPAPTKAWLSNLPAETCLDTLVAFARLRWRIERDYREGKGLVGLDHFEGRSWHGLHHHAALVVLAQQFLATERVAAVRADAPASPPTVTVPTAREGGATAGALAGSSSPPTVTAPTASDRPSVVPAPLASTPAATAAFSP